MSLDLAKRVRRLGRNVVNVCLYLNYFPLKAVDMKRITVLSIWFKYKSCSNFRHKRDNVPLNVIVKDESSMYLTCFSAFVQCTLHEINIF